MTQFLPPNLLALFAAREPIQYLPPPDKLPHEKKTRGYAGVGAFLNDFEVFSVIWVFLDIFSWRFHFQDPKDTPAPTRVETKEERIERRRREKAEQVAYKLEREIATWDPNNIESLTEDPFKTLFVARIVSSFKFPVMSVIQLDYASRTTTPPSPNCDESSRPTARSRRSSSTTTSTRESLADTLLLSTNMNATCTVSICDGCNNRFPPNRTS